MNEEIGAWLLRLVNSTTQDEDLRGYLLEEVFTTLERGKRATLKKDIEQKNRARVRLFLRERTKAYRIAEAREGSKCFAISYENSDWQEAELYKHSNPRQVVVKWNPIILELVKYIHLSDLEVDASLREKVSIVRDCFTLTGPRNRQVIERVTNGESPKVVAESMGITEASAITSVTQFSARCVKALGSAL